MIFYILFTIKPNTTRLELEGLILQYNYVKENSKLYPGEEGNWLGYYLYNKQRDLSPWRVSDVNASIVNSIYNTIYIKYMYLQEKNEDLIKFLIDEFEFDETKFKLVFYDKNERSIIVSELTIHLYFDFLVYIYKESRFSTSISKNKSTRFSTFIKYFSYYCTIIQPLNYNNTYVLDYLRPKLKLYNDTQLMFIISANPDRIIQFNLLNLIFKEDQIINLLSNRFRLVRNESLTKKFYNLLDKFTTFPNEIKFNKNKNKLALEFLNILDINSIAIDENVKNNSLEFKPTNNDYYELYFPNNKFDLINKIVSNEGYKSYLKVEINNSYTTLLIHKNIYICKAIDNSSQDTFFDKFLFLRANKYLNLLLKYFFTSEEVNKNILFYMSEKDYENDVMNFAWTLKYKNYILIKISFFNQFDYITNEILFKLTNYEYALEHKDRLFRREKFYIKQNKESLKITNTSSDKSLNLFKEKINMLNIDLNREQLFYIKNTIFNKFLYIKFDLIHDLIAQNSTLDSKLNKDKLFLIKDSLLLEPFNLKNKIVDLSCDFDYDAPLNDFKNDISANLTTLLYLASVYSNYLMKLLSNNELIAIDKCIPCLKVYNKALLLKYADNVNSDPESVPEYKYGDFELLTLINKNLNSNINLFLNKNYSTTKINQIELINLLDLITDVFYHNNSCINMLKSNLITMNNISKIPTISSAVNGFNHIKLIEYIKNNTTNYDINVVLSLLYSKNELESMSNDTDLYNRIKINIYLHIFYIKQGLILKFNQNSEFIFLAENTFNIDYNTVINLYVVYSGDLNNIIRLLENLNVYIQRIQNLNTFLSSLDMIDDYYKDFKKFKFNYFLCFRGRVYSQEPRIDWINNKLFRHIYTILNKSANNIFNLRCSYLRLISKQNFLIYQYNIHELLRIANWVIEYYSKLFDYNLVKKLKKFYEKYKSIREYNLAIESNIINNYFEEILFLDSMFWIICNLGYINGNKLEIKTYSYKLLIDTGFEFFYFLRKNKFNISIEDLNLTVDQTITLNSYLNFFKSKEYFDSKDLLSSKLSVSLDSSCNGYTQLINILSALDKSKIQEYKENLNLIELDRSRDFYQFITDQLWELYLIKYDGIQELEFKNNSQYMFDSGLDGDIKFNIDDKNKNLYKKIFDFTKKNKNIIFNRKTFKKILMTIPYGATKFNFTGVLNTNLASIFSTEHDKFFKKIFFKLIIDCVADIFYSDNINSKSIIDYNIIKFLEKHIKKNETTIEDIYIELSDLKINLIYNEIEKKRYNLVVNQGTINSTTYSLYKLKNKINTKKLIQALSANSAHAYDSNIMRLMIQTCDVPFLNVHDCFKVHISNASYLMRFYSHIYIHVHTNYRYLNKFIISYKDGSQKTLLSLLREDVVLYNNTIDRLENLNILNGINKANYILKI